MARYQGDNRRVVEFQTRGLAVFRGLGNNFAAAHGLNRYGRDVALAQRHYDEAVAVFKESLLLSREVRSRWRSEVNLEGLAQVAAAKGQHKHAARLFGAADAQYEIVGQPYEPIDQASHDQSMVSTREALGDAPFAEAWAEGRAMTLDQAVEYALAWVERVKPVKARHPGRKPKDDTLTSREYEVAALVARGRTNREIATALVISERTVDAHVQNILNKFGFGARAQIAVWITERGLGAESRPDGADSQASS
jgi:DNA-binding CsgD family transcriptional regulator